MKSMKHQSRQKKVYEIDREGRITIYPSLYGTKEKGKLKQLIKQLIHLRKGH